jgi:hypothetical protein
MAIDFASANPTSLSASRYQYHIFSLHLVGEEYPFARSSSLARSFSFPEALRRNSECPVETRRSVFPCDGHRKFSDSVIIEMLLQACEQLVVDVTCRHRVGIFQRDFLGIAEKLTFRIVVEGVDFVCRSAMSAAHGSIHVLSELTTVPPCDPSI